MQPETPYSEVQATSDPAVASARPGMTVVDAAGAQAGTVTAVQPPGTDVRPDSPAGIAEHLMATGYLRIDGTGQLSNDTYASGDQIAGVDADVVTLGVPRADLTRVTE